VPRPKDYHEYVAETYSASNPSLVATAVDWPDRCTSAPRCILDTGPQEKAYAMAEGAAGPWRLQTL